MSYIIPELLGLNFAYISRLQHMLLNVCFINLNRLKNPQTAMTACKTFQWYDIDFQIWEFVKNIWRFLENCPDWSVHNNNNIFHRKRNIFWFGQITVWSYYSGPNNWRPKYIEPNILLSLLWPLLTFMISSDQPKFKESE